MGAIDNSPVIYYRGLRYSYEISPVGTAEITMEIKNHRLTWDVSDVSLMVTHVFSQTMVLFIVAVRPA